MPIIIKAQGNENTNDLIKKFKKATVATDIVQIAKNRRYYQKPSKIRATYKIERNRLRRRARTLKHMKNVSPQVIAKIEERLSA